MLLEAAASRAYRNHPELLFGLNQTWTIENNGMLNLTQLARHIVKQRLAGSTPTEVLAWQFESSLASALLDWTLTLRQRLVDAGHIKDDNRLVALTGGCLVNRTLSARLINGLKDAGLEPQLPKSAPSGDGGLALGQAWLARLAYDNGFSEQVFKGSLFELK